MGSRRAKYSALASGSWVAAIAYALRAGATGRQLRTDSCSISLATTSGIVRCASEWVGEQTIDPGTQRTQAAPHVACGAVDAGGASPLGTVAD